MACRLDAIAVRACRRMTSCKSINKMTSIRSQQFHLGNTAALTICTPHMRPNPSLVSIEASCRSFHSTSYTPNDPSPASDDTSSKLSPKLEEIFQKILYLDMVEVHLLTELINEKIGLKLSDREREQMAKGGGGGGGTKSDDDAKEEVKEEQTAFDLKLTGFDAKAKIKVIKEVRSITGLGLKEAKELVEGVPSAIKKGIKKEEAEELKAKLEAVGAQLEIS